MSFGRIITFFTISLFSYEILLKFENEIFDIKYEKQSQIYVVK